MRLWFLTLPLLLGLALAQPFRVTDATGREVEVRSTERIVSVGGSISEILDKFGLTERIVGRDTGSYIPAALLKKPDVGLFFRLNAEALLAQRPTLVLAVSEAGPPPVLAQLRQAGVSVVLVPDEPTPEGVKKKIRTIGAAVGQPARAEELVRALERDLLALRSKTRVRRGEPLRVLYIYPRDPRNTFVCGEEASGAGLITLAGAQNAVKTVQGAGAVRGCVNITAEAVVAARPEAIVVPFFPDQPFSFENILRLPGVAETPAGRNRRIVAMDVTYISGYGYTAGRAALELHQALYEKTGPVRINHPSFNP
ncbi:heme/hemin ABC transporter substrate-binding protein [Meiothermus cerbereus]|uniref:heme/hemin ABC transporter substrate-binding protein n=1 Tax=Meiothermus cerbereus TaxID=65552 RepID=UPI003EF05B8B